jgi:hypothetical protein
LASRQFGFALAPSSDHRRLRLHLAIIPDEDCAAIARQFGVAPVSGESVAEKISRSCFSSVVVSRIGPVGGPRRAGNPGSPQSRGMLCRTDRIFPHADGPAATRQSVT